MHTLTKSLKNIVDDGKEKGYEESKIRVMLKEYLQNIILYILYNNVETSKLIFYGGSCLRKIYGLDRFSEDLDFENPDKVPLDILPRIIEEYFNTIKMKGVECKVQKSEHISRVLVKFPVVKDIGLSDNENEKIHIKVEVNRSMTGKYSTELVSKMLGGYSLILRH